MSRGGGVDARFHGCNGLLAGANGIHPIGKVEQFAVGIVVEIRAARSRAQDPFFVGEFFGSNLRIKFVASPVEIQRAVRAHQFDHGGVARIAERAFEIDLHFLFGIVQDGLNGVGRFPDALGGKPVADTGGGGWMVKAENPVHDVDLVDHEVSKDAAAEIPEPAPLAEAVRIEILSACGAEPGLPIDGAGIDGVLLGGARGIAIPGDVGFVDLADLAGENEVAALFHVRHAALLGTDLDDASGVTGSLENGLLFGAGVGKRLFHVHVLACAASGYGEWDVLMIGRSDDDGIDIFAGEEFAVVRSGKGAGSGDLTRLFEVFPPDIADGGKAGVGEALNVADESLGAAPGADAADVQGFVCAEDTLGGCRCESQGLGCLAAGGIPVRFHILSIDLSYGR